MSEAKDNILARKRVEEGRRCELREEGICEWKELILQFRVPRREWQKGCHRDWQMHSLAPYLSLVLLTLGATFPLLTCLGYVGWGRQENSRKGRQNLLLS